MKNSVKIIKREKYLNEIRPFYDSNYIKVITGIRRCGKSEIIHQIQEELLKSGVNKKQIIFFDLENPKYFHIKTVEIFLDELNRLVKNKKKYYIFIDEVQHIKNFEILIAGIRNGYNCSLFVTGSNSKLLKGKMQDRLTGRAKEFEIMPFTYAESLAYKKANNIKIEKNDFDDYLKWGGMPQRYEEQSEDNVKKYLLGLYESIIKKDVFENHKRVDKQRFKLVSNYIMPTAGQIFSSLSIAKFLKDELKIRDTKSLSKTINEYANHLIECYFIKECPSYNFASKRTISYLRKFYTVDNGFKRIWDDPIDFEVTFALENVIYNELKYRGYDVYYARNRDKEIDFVVIKNNKKCFIQVAFSINSEKTFNREYGALKKIRSNHNKYVFSLDTIDSSNDGITHVNIVDFLIGKSNILLN